MLDDIVYSKFGHKLCKDWLLFRSVVSDRYIIIFQVISKVITTWLWSLNWLNMVTINYLQNFKSEIKISKGHYFINLINLLCKNMFYGLSSKCLPGKCEVLSLIFGTLTTTKKRIYSKLNVMFKLPLCCS